MATGSKTFDIFEQQFSCNTVAKLKDCNSVNHYYVSDALSYNSTIISTGDTFSAKINTPEGVKYLCLYYVSDDSGSSNSYIETIYGISSDCGSCTPPVPPTPTPSNTPTPSVTPTNTPTPSPSYVSPNALYVYSACTGTNRVISQTVSVASVSVGQSFEYDGECWTYVGLYYSPYSPPTGFIYTTSTTNVFGAPSTVYNDCDSCVSAPTPSIAHSVQWAWTYDCPVCDLVGTPTTVYTTTSYPSLGPGAAIYDDPNLVSFYSPGRYITDGNDVYSVGSNGVLTLECSIGLGC